MAGFPMSPAAAADSVQTPQMHPLLVRVITVGISAVVSALIAWGALQQQVKMIEANNAEVRQELRAMRQSIIQIATDQARTATAIEYIGRGKRK